ncbi:phytanoyl-CoA dioxygenase [Legionella beliardensis]|uniref:Phytanoyl-CoA dioxygenase n=1 Tax=Legionella beliardensis TaxID=91822 RepID=A0A378HZA2_9GAMM|nr:phytanoyl-CoA dioxygenase family protein [Legionella beliardensis]STX28268.1 phytanoyl-CoA dioxygenase [Legionella beliardensis]
MDLTAPQIEYFQDNGYLVIDNFFPPTTCEELIERIHWLLVNQQHEIPFTIFSTQTNEHVRTEYFLDSGDKIHFFFEPDSFDEAGNMKQPLEKSLNKIGHALHELDPVFRKYSYDLRLKNICHQLGFQKPSLLQSMYIFKQPNIGAEVNLHQDSSFLHAENSEILGFWFALEDATINNGCLQVIPSPCTTPLSMRMIRKDNTIYFENYHRLIWQEEDCTPLEVKQGSVILLHGRLPHRSNANLSNQSRHAYTLHVIDAAFPYPSSNWLQRAQGLAEWN